MRVEVAGRKKVVGYEKERETVEEGRWVVCSLGGG
jgi:hypothetical protein